MCDDYATPFPLDGEVVLLGERCGDLPVQQGPLPVQVVQGCLEPVQELLGGGTGGVEVVLGFDLQVEGRG